MSAIKVFGGKHYLAKKIRERFCPHTRYVEAFFGSGAVLFSGDGQNVSEYANDLNLNLSHFWWVLANQFEEFARKVSMTPFSEPVFDAALSRLQSRTMHGIARMPVDAAVDFFIVNRQSRQAMGKDFATPTKRLRSGMNEHVSAWLSAVDGLYESHQRMRRVEVRCLPAVEIIRELDSPETLVYADPPYLHSTRVTTKGYQHEMSSQDHVELLETLSVMKGKFVLSGYPSAMYDEHAKQYGWRYEDFDLPNNASGKKEKQRMTERLWFNY